MDRKMTGGNFSPAYDRLRPDQQFDPGSNEKSALTNWHYTDPPVLRSSRLGSNWRHLTACHAHGGNHMVFVDGMVKQVDGMRYPPYGSKERLPHGVSHTTHAPETQLKQHSQFAIQNLGLQPPRPYEIGNTVQSRPSSNYFAAGFSDPSYSQQIDPFSAYRMGVQHGFTLSHMNLDQMFIDDQAPQPPWQQGWQQQQQQQQQQQAQCNNYNSTRGPQRVPSRAGSAMFGGRPPSAPRPPSTASSRKPSETSVNFELCANNVPSKKPYTRYTYTGKNNIKKPPSRSGSRRSLALNNNANVGIPGTTMEPYTY